MWQKPYEEDAADLPGFRLCLAIQPEIPEAAQQQEVLHHVQCTSHLTEQQHSVPCDTSHCLHTQALYKYLMTHAMVIIKRLLLLCAE